MPDGVRLLASTTLFRGFSEQELEPLASRLQPRSFPRGTYVFREGDPGHTLYVIATGQVKIAHLGRQGEEIVFALLTTGDTFGELALFDDGSTRTADAQATEPTDCLALSREPFMAFAETHPRLMRHLIKVLSVYLRRADEALGEAAFLDITGRVAKKLLDLAESHGEPTKDGVRIGVHVTQQTLAGMIGASRENVNRAVSRFVARGDIAQEAGTITILRPTELRKRS
jgi:CRP/FNR family transcriptional regulator/CRP/FNR family cyclic AMP-dependent transcriptional regulator